jgi:D-alanine-D-alanine ligase
MRGSGPFTFAALERVLTDDEKIFTSMDVRPITGARCRPIDPAAESELLGRLHGLAREVFLEFNLGSVIRLDIRADEAGDLHILEANPKPDLKRPSGDKLSLVCAGLAEHGMSYDDLILSLLADRVDVLFSQRRGTVNHLLQLLD